LAPTTNGERVDIGLLDSSVPPWERGPALTSRPGTCHRCGWRREVSRVTRKVRRRLGVGRAYGRLCDECLNDLEGIRDNRGISGPKHERPGAWRECDNVRPRLRIMSWCDVDHLRRSVDRELSVRPCALRRN